MWISVASTFLNRIMFAGVDGFSKQIIDHALKSVEIAPQCLCPARHMSPAMWICSQPNMSKNIEHRYVDVQWTLFTRVWKLRSARSRILVGVACEAPPSLIVSFTHGTTIILLKMMMIVLGISTNLVRIMWISGNGDLCVCACTCVCTTTLSLAVIWIVQNGSKFDPYRPPGFQQPSPLQHMLVHNIESAFLNIFKLAS